MAKEPHRAESSIGKLRNELPELAISTRLSDRLSLAVTGAPEARGDDDRGPLSSDLPAAVCWPEREEDVVGLVKQARRLRVPLIPVGGASSLMRGAQSGSGALAVDLKRFDHIVEIRPHDCVVRVQAGVLGVHLEERLRSEGLTLGHDPSSMSFATVGGYLSTRSAGSRSFGGGKIEDRALSLRVVTGAGEVLETGRPVGPGPGPDWTQVFVGSEGVLGILLEGTLRVARLPESQRFAVYGFRRFEGGVRATRLLAQADLSPTLVKLFDAGASLFLRAFHTPQGEVPFWLRRLLALKGEGTVGARLGRRALRLALSRSGGASWLLEQFSTRVAREGCLLLVGHEGSGRLVDASARLTHRLLLEAGGRDLGPELAIRWAQRRFGEGARWATLSRAGIQVDRLDVAVTWSRLERVHQDVLRAVSPYAVALGQISHVYPSGVGLLYTFLSTPRRERARGETEDPLLRSALQAVVRSGGSIGHHLGVGRRKAGLVREELGTALPLLEALKATLDPDGILNPGVLGLS